MSSTSRYSPDEESPPNFEALNSNLFTLGDEDGWVEDDDLTSLVFGSNINAPNSLHIPTHAESSHTTTTTTHLPPLITFTDIEMKYEKKEVKERFAFKTKSEVEILDDGFRWRKYGKKMVKNSPNPRNYYRCSVEGCSVKKRVERDKEDPSYIITTYEGFHSHGTIY